MSDSDITRKEAIKVLEMFLHKQCSLGRTEFAYDADTVREAVNMATESLKTDEAYQLEYEKALHEVEAKDCRSLKDIKEMIERKAEDLDGMMLDAGGVCIGLYFAIAIDLPPVTPKNDKPSGKWIEYANSHCECPFCHTEFSYYDNETELFNYCPKCGVCLVEEQGENK